ncbi:hypothetical protein EHS25_002295 [Saitozyma podzolica]|uniref:Pantothenate kinase n=1 Tax=Saitozyma podzolica TaxID=1890683 RepID=A0A427YDP7_9TREE|nr:hypothetical protein EHS25_002295 [Saitozyma podzolica]
MPDISIPQARRIVVDTTGAQIVQEESPATRDSRGIYLPHYIEPVSHIAIDIGGSLAKVVYFTRSPHPIAKTPPETAPSSPFLPALQPNTSASAPPTSSIPATSLDVPSTTAASDGNGAASSTSPSRPHLNGALTPGILASDYHSSHRASVSSPIRTSTSLSGHPISDGLHFPRPFPEELIATSATANRVSLERMKSTVKVMATGGGAHKYYNRLRDELGVEVRREEEMECLILGLGFVIHIPEEVFWFSEELVYKVSHPDPAHPIELERPSPQPPLYHVTFAPEPGSGEAAPHFPCLVVNIGSGVSIVKVDEDGSFERVSGTSLGGGTLWGLLSLLTDANSFDEMLLLSEKGDNAAVDMLVGDIYGSDYAKIGLKSSTIASTFGKVFRKDSKPGERRKRFKQEDIAKSLLYAISNNIGHVAYMNAAKYGLDRVFFSGCFIRGHAATISTLSYAIRFWSKGTMRACFLRHEGFLGAIGAWIKNVQAAAQGEQGDQGESAIIEDGDGPDGGGCSRPEEAIEKEK